jgi:hypothetical protein
MKISKNIRIEFDITELGVDSYTVSIFVDGEKVGLITKLDLSLNVEERYGTLKLEKRRDLLDLLTTFVE